jgi:hypothetical protein
MTKDQVTKMLLDAYDEAEKAVGGPMRDYPAAMGKLQAQVFIAATELRYVDGAANQSLMRARAAACVCNLDDQDAILALPILP